MVIDEPAEPDQPTITFECPDGNVVIHDKHSSLVERGLC